MCEGVDLFELADADLRVNLGGIELGVTEKLLDVAHICAVLQHRRGAGVAKEVARPGLADVCCCDVISDKLAHSVGGEGLSEVGQEQVGSVPVRS